MPQVVAQTNEMGLAQGCQQQQLSKTDTIRLTCQVGPGPAGEVGAPGRGAADQREGVKACEEAEAVREDRKALSVTRKQVTLRDAVPGKRENEFSAALGHLQL